MDKLKLKLIRIGDEVSFDLNGVKCRAQVVGWALHDRAHYALVPGRGDRDTAIALQRITARRRGMDEVSFSG